MYQAFSAGNTSKVFAHAVKMTSVTEAPLGRFLTATRMSISTVTLNIGACQAVTMWRAMTFSVLLNGRSTAFTSWFILASFKKCLIHRTTFCFDEGVTGHSPGCSSGRF